MAVQAFYEIRTTYLVNVLFTFGAWYPTLYVPAFMSAGTMNDAVVAVAVTGTILLSVKNPVLIEFICLPCNVILLPGLACGGEQPVTSGFKGPVPESLSLGM